MLSLRVHECEALAAGVRDAGGTCAWAAVDLRDEEQTADGFTAGTDAFGRIDGLFAVAGASGRDAGDGPVGDVPPAGWDETLRRNLTPAFLAARAAVRTMLGQEPSTAGRGAIVLVTSVLAWHPSLLFTTHAYAAAKGAVSSLTRAMAARYAPDLIRVNALAPGLVDTSMARRAAADPPSVAYARTRQPLARGLLTADDVAAAAEFLLSDDARVVTGQILGVDGGWAVSEGAAAPGATNV